MDSTTTIISGLLGSVTLLASFILIHYISNNFTKLAEKTDKLEEKSFEANRSITQATEKITFAIREMEILSRNIDDIQAFINSSDFNSTIKEKIEDIEEIISKVQQEIHGLDKNSLIRTKDLQVISDMLKDLSHETEMKFKIADFHYASVLEDLELLKRQCENYKSKISKIEAQLYHLEKTIKQKEK